MPHEVWLDVLPPSPAPHWESGPAHDPGESQWEEGAPAQTVTDQCSDEVWCCSQKALVEDKKPNPAFGNWQCSQEIVKCPVEPLTLTIFNWWIGSSAGLCNPIQGTELGNQTTLKASALVCV